MFGNCYKMQIREQNPFIGCIGCLLFCDGTVMEI
jgi:hypothetical protein